MSAHPYLAEMPALMLGDYHGRVVSPDGQQIFSVCGHARAPLRVWVVPYISGIHSHASPVPRALPPEAVRLPLHFPEGLEFAVRVLARAGSAAGYTARPPRPPLVDIAKALAKASR